jgi:3-oxoadipate enol-lactonase
MPYHQVDSVSIHYELLGKGDQTIVFLNGVMMSTESWMFQTECFSKRFQLLLSDFRGQGLSSKPDEPYTFEQHCFELKSLLDHLGIKKAHFVGTSYGAEVGMKFAILYPEYVQSLCIAGAVSESNNLLRSKIESWCIAARHAIEFNKKRDFLLITAPFNYSSNFLERHPTFLEEKADMLVDYPDEWFSAFIRLCECFKTFNITKDLHKITTPVLVIAGEHDILKSVRFSALMKRQIPHAESLIIMDSGHALVIENAGEFNSALLGFIERHT